MLPPPLSLLQRLLPALATRLGPGMLALLAALLLASAPAQAGSYTAAASAATATAYPWIDISSSGTQLVLANDAVSAPLALGFSFNFGGTAYTTLRVMSNGMLQFAGNSTAGLNTVLPLNGSSGRPAIDAALLPLWDDLDPSLGGQVRWRSQGTAPNRVFIASWLSVRLASGTGGQISTFQVQLHEGGAIVFRYQNVDGQGGTHSNPLAGLSNPSGATVGIEVNNADYLLYARHSAVLASDTTIVFSPVATASTPTLAYLFNQSAWTGTAGEVIDSGPSQLHATAASLSATKPTTSRASPVIVGSSGSCDYGVFNRANKDHVALPAAVSNPSGSFTFTAWFRATAVSATGQRIYADDQNNTGGFHLTLGDPGSGLLRFTTRGTPSSPSLDTTTVVSANTWYFVAAGIDASTKMKFVQLWDGAGNLLESTSATYTEASYGSDAGAASLGGENNSAGAEATSSFGFGGNLDEVRVYSVALSTTQLQAVRALTTTCPSAALVAAYNFDEASYNGTAGEWKDSAGYSGGPFNGRTQGTPLPAPTYIIPARSGSPGTCAYATLSGANNGGGGFLVQGLPLSTSAGSNATVAFWMYWDGTDGVMPVGFSTYDLWLSGGSFGFNTGNGDIFGIGSSGLANGWHHVVAVFTNGRTTGNQLWIDGVAQTLTQRTGSANTANAVVATSLQAGGWTANGDYRFHGRLDQLRIHAGAATADQVAALYAEVPSTCAPPLHHLEIQHASGSGLTCTPSTLTIRACQDAACTSLYTGGVTGSLAASGGSVVWPDGSSFSIAAGSSSTTARLQATTTTATVLGTSGSSVPGAAYATSCNFGAPSCTFTAADAGFLFDVPHHVSEVAQTVSVSAVRKSDNSSVCTPAFASTSKAVTFSCGYTNPTSGTLPVRVGGTALNAGVSSAAACDASGSAVTLAFNASGVASTTVQYADVGQVLLSARYAGAAGGSEAGLVMTGSDSFIAAPDHFTIGGVTSGPIRAGNPFSATVTARNALGNATANHGRETAAQGAYIGWVKLQPTGAGAVAGSFSGSGLRSFSNGAVTASDLSWTEVGRGDLVVSGADASGYLGSGLHVFGSSLASGARHCAAEGGSCVLPGGTTATVYYGAPGGWAAKPAQTGSVACTNANFGDPLSGTAKRCYYAASAASNGSVGDVIPHRFTVAAGNTCGAFSYAGQPIPTTVTARNAAGNATLNYNGTASTTPGFAQAVTLSEATPLGLGTLSGSGIAASAFSAGVATATPAYAFTSKTTAPQSLVLRASNNAAGAALVSSLGYAEPTLPLRSGRLRLSNAFGKASAALQLVASIDYWGGNAWLLNSADNCTTVAANSVALSNPRSATGAASTATTSASALVISGGSGSISLAAPSPAGSSLSLDLAVNLGNTANDQSCLTSHPATTGAGKPWLQAQNGSCAATADRDPAARASFGIFSPETRKTVHVREIF
ncbi:MAG: LamG domain-containing protein [Pseudomonadota bacterium]